MQYEYIYGVCIKIFNYLQVKPAYIWGRGQLGFCYRQIFQGMPMVK
jgi:hypothetical protein